MVQAATSINEQTLELRPQADRGRHLPGPVRHAILMLLVDFTNDIFARIPELTR
jgi:flagellar biosynthetic protein FliQ